jgi:hypothetical protein
MPTLEVRERNYVYGELALEWETFPRPRILGMSPTPRLYPL